MSQEALLAQLQQPSPHLELQLGPQEVQVRKHQIWAGILLHSMLCGPASACQGFLWCSRASSMSSVCKGFGDTTSWTHRKS